MKLKEIAVGLIHLLYPRLCEGCAKPLLTAEQVLCTGCHAHLPKTEYHDINDNDTALRLAGRIPFQYATSFAYFTNDGLLQHLMHGLKYKGRKEIGIYLGRQFGIDLSGSTWATGIDFILPVPLSRRKEASRGYNQSALIAKGMSDTLNIPVLYDTLLRTRHTESQTQKSRAERIDNMKDAFTIHNQQLLAHKHVLIIDDVLTTGATIEACALALKDVPDVKISIASIGLAT